MGPDVMTVEVFLGRGLLLLDNDIQDRVEKAASNGNVLRYVCVIEGSRYLLFPPIFLCSIKHCCCASAHMILFFSSIVAYNLVMFDV